MIYLKAGFLWGFVFLAIHAGWAWVVASHYGQPLIDFLLKIHFLSNPFIVQNFDPQLGFILVGASGLFGFIAGVSLAFLLDFVFGDLFHSEELGDE